MKRSKPDDRQVIELLLQALETERGGIQVYSAAIKAAVNDDLRKEWQEYISKKPIDTKRC